MDPFDFADIHAALGDLDLAVHMIEKSFEDHSPQLAYALFLKRLHPQLWDQPRVKAVIERLRFPSRGG